jgi:hypothetical protein
MCNQVDEQLKDFGPHREPQAGSVQLIVLGIEGTVAKHVPHGPIVSPGTEADHNQKPWEAAGLDSSTKISPTITKIAPSCHASYLGTYYITVAAEPFSE